MPIQTTQEISISITVEQSSSMVDPSKIQKVEEMCSEFKTKNGEKITLTYPCLTFYF